MKRILLSLGLLSTLAFSKDCIDYYIDGNLNVAVSCYKELTINRNTADNNFYTATILVIQGRYKESIPYLKEAENLTNSRDQLKLIYNRFAIAYNSLNNSKLGVEYALKELNIGLQDNNSNTLASAYSNLALNYASLENYNKSIEYNLKALDYKKDNDKAITYSNLALNYVSINKLKLAEENYQNAIKNATYYNDLVSLCSAKTSYGSFKTTMKDFKESEKQLLEATKICNKKEIVSAEANGYIFLGLNSIEQKDLESAKKYQRIANKIVDQSGSEILYNNLKKLNSKIAKFK